MDIKENKFTLVVNGFSDTPPRSEYFVVLNDEIIIGTIKSGLGVMVVNVLHDDLGGFSTLHAAFEAAKSYYNRHY